MLKRLAFYAHLILRLPYLVYCLVWAYKVSQRDEAARVGWRKGAGR